MTPAPEVAYTAVAVKSLLLDQFSRKLDDVLASAPGTSRDAEALTWRVLLEVGRELLRALLTLACRAVFEGTAGTSPKSRLRLDDDYWLTQTTTLGPVRVPLFAYRDAGGRTRAPAREVVFPLHPRVRSSELLLQWETMLGTQLPWV